MVASSAASHVVLGFRCFLECGGLLPSNSEPWSVCICGRRVEGGRVRRLSQRVVTCDRGRGACVGAGIECRARSERKIDFENRSELFSNYP